MHWCAHQCMVIDLVESQRQTTARSLDQLHHRRIVPGRTLKAGKFKGCAGEGEAGAEAA